MIGQVLLNKYRIEALIGEGGFGKVYKATHIQLELSTRPEGFTAQQCRR